ncbi:retrotransposon protein, putative, ty1-copia subclass [Tanacetum coccineum]
MHNMGKTVGELHAMLIEYEKGLPKKAETPQVMMIKGGKFQKANKKSLKAKGKAKDDTCHHCKEVGHCKGNCPAYLAELIKKKKQVGTASSSDVLIIELFSFPTKSWVYDTSCGTHICITKHGLGGVRKLKQVEAIGSFDLVLSNGLVICLDNCHYAPSILRGVVSVHRLVENGFVQCFTDYGISVSSSIKARCLLTHTTQHGSERQKHLHFVFLNYDPEYERLQSDRTKRGAREVEMYLNKKHNDLLAKKLEAGNLQQDILSCSL